MSWGVELWDQFDSVSAHIQKGIDSLERYAQFIRERANLEADYGGRLRKLTRQYYPKKKELETEDLAAFSSQKGFMNMLGEINDLGGQHEVIGESLANSIYKELMAHVKECKEERKKCVNEGLRHQASLQQQLASLDRAKKAYEKSFKDAEKAADLFHKAENDLNLSRAEVEKQRTMSAYKGQQCEDSKGDYAQQLTSTNHFQKSFYQELLPAVFQAFQSIDERRINCLKSSMQAATEMEKNVNPIINTCLEGIKSAAASINHDIDSQVIVDRLKSGFFPPEDIPFEDLSAIKAGEQQPISMGHSGSGTSLDTVTNQLSYSSLQGKGDSTVSGKGKKRGGIRGFFSSGANTNTGGGVGNNVNLTVSSGGQKEPGREGDYSELPPAQRRRKLQEKIDEYNGKIQQENAAREALVKMQSVYKENPQLGNANSVENQLFESKAKLNKLNQELMRYQGFMNEVEGGSSAYRLSANSNKSQQPDLRNVNNTQHSQQYETQQQSQQKHQSVHCPIPPPMPNNDYVDGEGEDGEENYYEQDFEDEYVDGDEEPLPVLGTCVALFSFDATSEGNISMEDQESLFVVEIDQGDGWTRVRRLNSLTEGYVPTTYLSITLY